MKRKLITHTDMDGIGSSILSKIIFKNIDVTYCGYDNINTEALASLNQEYNVIFITDISVTDDVAKKIQSKSDQGNTFIRLFDHHRTALELNQYTFAFVEEECDRGATSGTYMFYEYLKENNYLPAQGQRFLSEFVELVRRYDTWEWKNKYNDEEPKKLNELFRILGQENFINNICKKFDKAKFTNEGFTFDEMDEFLLSIEENNRKKYMGMKEKRMIRYDLEEYKVGIVFASNYISDLGNYLSSKNKDLDFIAIISEGTVSYRTVKEGIDVGEIALKFGGGGHMKSAGSRISQDTQMRYIKDIFTCN